VLEVKAGRGGGKGAKKVPVMLPALRLWTETFYECHLQAMARCLIVLVVQGAESLGKASANGAAIQDLNLGNSQVTSWPFLTIFQM